MPSFMLIHSCRRRRYSALLIVPLTWRGRSGSFASAASGSAPMSGVGFALAARLRAASPCFTACLRSWPVTTGPKLIASIDRMMARAVGRAHLIDLFIANLLDSCVVTQCWNLWRRTCAALALHTSLLGQELPRAPESAVRLF